MNRFLAIYAAVLLSGCHRVDPAINQASPTTSPNSKFIAEFSIEPNTVDPPLGGSRVWKLSLFDLNHKLIYRDEDSHFLGNLNVYWGWDSKDRIWLYNSDDGYIWRWDFDGSSWKKNRVIGNKEREIPNFILPDYAKERIKTEQDAAANP